MSDRRRGRYDCLIVGAGMSGLVAAHRLREAGRTALVVDKGRGVGGRMATRRVDDAVFDHGAQFFTVRSDAFAAMVDSWRTAGVAQEWSRGFPGRSGTPSDGHPRYRGEPGMTAIAKHLARELDVRTGEQVVRVEPVETGWQLETKSGLRTEGSSLLLTCPVPQSLDLIETSRLSLSADDQADLRRIEYDPCLALLARLDGPSGLPAPGAMQLPEGPVTWMADNHQKGISPDAHAVTVHAGPVFSRSAWDRPDEHVVPALWAAVEPFVTAHLTSWQIQRWRFAQPTVLHPERCLVTDTPAPLVFAGDAFGGPKVEGAALSGWAAADSLLRLL